MIPSTHSLDDIFAELFDLEARAEQVEVEQGPDVRLRLGVAQGAGVEPADEELKRGVFGVRDTEGFGGGRLFGFVVECGGEEGGVVAEEFFVEDPVGGVGAYVDVDEGAGEESGRGLAIGMEERRVPRTHGEAFQALVRPWWRS